MVRYLVFVFKKTTIPVNYIYLLGKSRVALKKANGMTAIQNYQKKAKHPDLKKMIDLALQNFRNLPGTCALRLPSIHIIN